MGVCRGHGGYTGICIWAVTQIRVCGKGYSNYRSISIKNYPPTQDMDYASCKFDCFSGRHVLRSSCDCGKLDSGAVIKLYVL
jgi:hypothetical protein